METLKVLCLADDSVLGNPHRAHAPSLSPAPWPWLLVPGGPVGLLYHCNKCHTLGQLEQQKCVFSKFWRNVEVQDPGATSPGFFWAFFFTVEVAIFCTDPCLSVPAFPLFMRTHTPSQLGLGFTEMISYNLMTSLKSNTVRFWVIGEGTIQPIAVNKPASHLNSYSHVPWMTSVACWSLITSSYTVNYFPNLFPPSFCVSEKVGVKYRNSVSFFILPLGFFFFFLSLGEEKTNLSLKKEPSCFPLSFTGPSSAACDITSLPPLGNKTFN